MTNIAREHIIPLHLSSYPSTHLPMILCPVLNSGPDSRRGRQGVGVDTVKQVIRCLLLTIKVWSACRRRGGEEAVNREQEQKLSGDTQLQYCQDDGGRGDVPDEMF